MLKKYLKKSRKFIVLLFICTLIFLLVFELHKLPLSAVLYGFLLCSMVLFVVFWYDFIQQLKKYKSLQRLEQNILISIDKLPQSQDMVENQYNKLLGELYQEYQLLVSKTNLTKTEMMDFYTLWVHQIKTPISAISLLLQVDNVPENKLISQELFRIEQYTQLVLGYLSIEDISADLMLKKCDIDKVINKAIKKYALVFIHKKINIEKINTNKTVITDEKWLLFVIEQLLSNALKYTRTGTIKIYMDKCELIIQDTGIGIRPEDVTRIFEKSFTGFNGRMEEKATGLGLYLCKKTLDKLNHKITIISEQGVGTNVIIDLSQSIIVHE